MKRIWIPQVIVAFLLFIALIPGLPYGYFTLLRIICTGCFAYLTYKCIDEEIKVWGWIFAFMAILFNPIIPIYLSRGTWGVIDSITAIMSLLSIYFIRKDEN